MVKLLLNEKCNVTLFSVDNAVNVFFSSLLMSLF